MSMAAFRSNVREMIAQAIAGTGQLKLGIVTDYDPDRPAVKVNLQPENIETGWMQMVSLLAGPSFGIFVGPTAGLEALVIFQEGDLQVGVCIGFLGNDEDVPPSVSAGQMLIVDSSGSSIAFTNDTKLAITAQGGLTINANVTINGDAHATGTVTGDTDVLSGGGKISGKGHKHPGVQSGSNESGGPTNT